MSQLFTSLWEKSGRMMSLKAVVVFSEPFVTLLWRAGGTDGSLQNWATSELKRCRLCVFETLQLLEPEKQTAAHTEHTHASHPHTHTHIVKHSHTCKLTHSHTQTHSMCTEATEKQRRWQISVGEEVVGVNYSGVCERGRETKEGGRLFFWVSLRKTRNYSLVWVQDT